MKTVKLVLAALALALASVSALAQPQASVDAEQRAAVKELLDVMNFKQMMTQISGPMMQQMNQMIDQIMESSRSARKLTLEQKDILRKAVQESSAKSSKAMADLFNDPQVIQGFEDVMARAYAKNFTTAEIKATTAFYVSTAGNKALNLMPRMTQEIMPEIMAIIAPKMSAIMESTTKDFAKQIEQSGKGKDEPVAK